VIVTLRPGASREDIAALTGYLDQKGLRHHTIPSPKRTVIEVHGTIATEHSQWLTQMRQVDEVSAGSRPVLAGRGSDEATREIRLNDLAVIGGRKLAIIAGPCSVEDDVQLLEAAHAAREAGAVGLRGGAFKPRTSPYSFQGMGEEGLELLARAGEETGLAIVTEVMCEEHVDVVARHADMLQVGSRNMHNYSLLASVGRQSKPILLKRGWAASLDEFLFSAEYVLKEGNEKVVLCERGIRTFESHVRNTLALGVVPMVKQQSCLPIIVDPSHGMGRRDLVAPMSKAAVACGADGLLIEMHPHPDEAWSDAGQTISPDQFRELMSDLSRLAPVCDRST
jgi:3-deoxy-7-phosphoheptulonate synthase